MLHKKGLMVLAIILGLLLPVIASAQNGGAQASNSQVSKLTFFPDDPTSLEFRDANVQNALRSLALPYKVNLLVSERVKGTVTASFHEVPIREVFLAILQDAGLGYVQQGRILRVDTLKAIKASRKQTKSVTEPVTKHIQVKYAFDSENNKDLTDLSVEVTKLLGTSKGAHLSIIKRTNTFVVTDLPENVAKIEAMVAKLDVPSKQIAISAKIISANDDFSRELGIQWGGKNINSMGHSNITLQGGTNTGNKDSGWKTNKRKGLPSASDTYNTGSESGTNYAVNLPAAVGSGVGGAFNLMIGKIGGDILEMQLSAMESENKGKILASPKVITQDNQTAKMETKTEVPYRVISTSATGNIISYQYKNVVIALEVTPHVIGERIFMDVKVNKADIIENIDAQIPPRIKTNTLTTKVLVNSGDTIVIGGLIQRTESKGEGGIPWLKDIPLIGWLFKHKKASDKKAELLIFITPTIFPDGQAVVEGSTPAEETTPVKGELLEGKTPVKEKSLVEG